MDGVGACIYWDDIVRTNAQGLQPTRKSLGVSVHERSERGRNISAREKHGGLIRGYIISPPWCFREGLLRATRKLFSVNSRSLDKVEVLLATPLEPRSRHDRHETCAQSFEAEPRKITVIGKQMPGDSSDSRTFGDISESARNAHLRDVIADPDRDFSMKVCRVFMWFP